MNNRVLSDYFGSRLQMGVPLANLTTARVGGAAHYFVVSRNAVELESDVRFTWSTGYPVFILGSGANVLISDTGLDAIVIHNQAKMIKVNTDLPDPTIQAESGANIGTIAREAAKYNLTGLEWASTIPGTLGGAIYGNAGAHGGNMQGSLIMAEILHRDKGRLSLNSGQMEFHYRSSLLKREPGSAVILSATLAVTKGNAEVIKVKMEENAFKRRITQPPGANMGSTFKNPEGDYAGKLIEAAGLKGTRIGGVQVSPIHANFLINDGTASAEDIHRLILLIQQNVKKQFGIDLELEIELLGDWQD